MKTMTKRDVADIALIWIGLNIFVRYLAALCTVIVRLSIADAPNTTWDSPISLYHLHTVVLFIMAFILLFKRRCILNLLCPLSGQTEIEVSDGCAALTDLGFWIRLLGTFTFIQAVIKVLSHLAQYFPVQNTNFGSGFVWSAITPPLVAAPLALLVVWQADRIAALMNKLGKSNRPPGA